MAQGIIHHIDADHGTGLIRSDVDGEILRFTVEDQSGGVRREIEPGARVRYDVAMGTGGKQAVRVSPI